jgi:hypothetical protein
MIKDGFAVLVTSNLLVVYSSLKKLSERRSVYSSTRVFHRMRVCVKLLRVTLQGVLQRLSTRMTRIGYFRQVQLHTYKKGETEMSTWITLEFNDLHDQRCLKGRYREARMRSSYSYSYKNSRNTDE